MNAANHPTVYTVGHSTHSIEKFIQILERNNINAVADVRSRPYSRYNPQFNRETICSALKIAGISYVFVGKELGARTDDLSCYEAGQVRYEKLARTQLFQSGIQRILNGAAQYDIAIMCAEKEPLDCHRTLLVARELDRSGAYIKHVMADGRLESHDATISRLLSMVGLPQEDMFRSRQELVDEAYRLREKRVAYVEEMLTDEQE